MKLRGVDFGNVFGASGVQGFFGEGYWFHNIPFRKPDFTGMTFVSKTATLKPREGNMSLTEDFKPRHWFPSCVRVQWNGNILNAVGLSNPGLLALLKTRGWQKRAEPFFISIMSLEDTPQKRFKEFRIIAEMISYFKKSFSAPFGLQVNLSCPNTEHSPSELISESAEVFEILSVIDVPLMPKYSIASAPIKAVMELNGNPNCDSICVSNTLPFGWPGINWRKVWGSSVSPLAHLGGGGLSGPELLPHVCRWIRSLRDLGFEKPINSGGGIFCPSDVDKYHQAGADSIFVGTVATRHPRRVLSIVQHANQVKWR